ncbi:hypothetical protein HY969_01645 [Candidatus Kaiserbacteria bacterium]|nr:hypothetical protein [Candidatus Kaiserbacteria bacterium]
MKILLVWPTSLPEIKVLLDEIENAGHEIVYWVGEHSVSHLTPKGTVFHDHYDAWDAKPAEAYKDEVFFPPNAHDIASMYRLESEILTMMNKHYDGAPVDERKHVYYTMLSYWSAVLDRLKPDALVFNDVPHSLYSNVVWELAKVRGIRSVMFEGTLAAGRVVGYSDVWEGNTELTSAVRENLKKNITVDDLGEEMHTYWNEIVSRGDTPIWYIQDQKARAAGFTLARIRFFAALRALRNGTLLPLVWNFVSRSVVKDLRSEYRDVVRPADLTKPFVFFALNFQPERSSSPQGGVFHDQILAAETLAAALPEGWELYIKEHPSQWLLRTKTRYSSARYRGYYRRLAAIPRVRLVPTNMPVRQLVEASLAVATITGSVGVEAVVRGKHALIFGAVWYRDCPGVVRVQSVEDCERIFEEVKAGKKVTKEGALAFLKALETVGVRTNVGDKVLRMSLEEEMKAFARSALERIGKE